MARDDHIDAGRRRIEVEFREIVKHVEEPAGQLDEFRLRIPGRPLIPVDVASYRRSRRDLAQSRDHFGAADIARMNDVVDAASRSTASGRKRPCVSEMMPIFMIEAVPRQVILLRLGTDVQPPLEARHEGAAAHIGSVGPDTLATAA